MAENSEPKDEAASDGAAKRNDAGDFIAGFVIFLIGAYALYESVRMPFYGQSGVWGSPGLTPGLIGAVLIVLSAALMYRARRFRLPALSMSLSSNAQRGLMTFGLIVAYVAVLPRIGYAPATFIMLFVFQLLFAQTRNWKFLLLWALGLSAGLTAVLYYVFAEIFLIPLP
jgi:divalent metal cation (Fe/Co/Zn/Cd) transporter